MFENWMKNVLSDYSIDNDDKTLIEQYESTQFNIEETVEKLISTQFSALNAEAKAWSFLIKIWLLYNKASNDRLK